MSSALTLDGGDRRERFVRPELRPWVSGYRDIDRAGQRRMHIPHSGKSFLLVHYGEGLVTQLRASPTDAGPAVLTGPPPGPFVTQRVGSRFRFVAADLTAIGAFGLFGGGLPEPLYAPLSDVVAPHRARALVERVTACAGSAERIEALEAFLLEQARRTSHTGHHARHAARFLALAEQRPRARVGELQRTLGVSGALLRRALRETALSSPKAVLQSARLNRAFVKMVDHPGTSLTDLAHALDFHDQAHFTRAFKAYSGFAPSKLPRDLSRLARWMM
ncbi:MAG: helix-turn-helix domain-containing protein [Sandaracinaceae bacterium]